VIVRLDKYSSFSFLRLVKHNSAVLSDAHICDFALYCTANAIASISSRFSVCTINFFAFDGETTVLTVVLIGLQANSVELAVFARVAVTGVCFVQFSLLSICL